MDLLLLIAVLALPLSVAFALGKWRDEYSRRKICFISASIIPVPVALMCGFVIANAMVTPKENCGVDACGMAIVAGLTGLAGAVAFFLAGFAVSFVIVTLLRMRRGNHIEDKVFE